MAQLEDDKGIDIVSTDVPPGADVVEEKTQVQNSDTLDIAVDTKKSLNFFPLTFIIVHFGK